MDPIGFALENFDVDGDMADERIVGGFALDTADVLPDGTRIEGVGGLRHALLKRPEVFVQTLTEKLLLYAVGRGLDARGHAGRPRASSASARGQDYRFSSLVTGIVVERAVSDADEGSSGNESDY